MACIEQSLFVAYVERRLGDAELEQAEKHLDVCASCRAVIAELIPLAERPDGPEPTSGSVEPLGRGTSIGRYLILQRLGAGAMGVVYAAYDPELNRKVALKLLRTGGDGLEQRETQLVREARALARLSHRNVVTLFDVGSAMGRVFIAMELLEGETLSVWMRQQPRHAREVLHVFRQAGAGLAAAHARGLVHRDFKPDNVLVGHDGRVCVTDFGLARALGQEETTPSPLPMQMAGTSITRTGTLVGTPAYMSPEQHRGARADERSDQFSFCVALWEALYGERPFAGATVGELAAAVVEGRVRPAPPASSIPARLRNVLLRGLEHAPSDRHASMASLLLALGSDPRAARLRLLGRVIAPTAVLLVGVAAFVGSERRQDRLCRGAAEKLEGVWDAARKQDVRDRLLAIDKPFAGDVWRAVERALDEYAHDWATAHTDSCRATRVRGEQSDEMLSRSMLCLDERKKELAALARTLAAADAQVLEHAVDASAALTAISVCRDPAALAAQIPPPAGPALAARVALVRQELVTVKALADTGKFGEALTRSRAASAQAGETQYRPLIAETLLRQGEVEGRLGRLKAAEQSFTGAAWNAEASRHDEVAADAWAQLIHVLAYQPDLQKAGSALDRAEAAVARLSRETIADEHLAHGKGLLLLGRGQIAEALALYRTHLAWLERRLGPDSIGLAASLHDFAYSLLLDGRYAEAAQLEERTLAIREKILGPNHPAVASARLRLGEDQLGLGLAAAAERSFREALPVEERLWGPRHTAIVESLLGLGEARAFLGHPEEALELIRRGLEIEEKAWGKGHASAALARVSLARVLLRQKRYAEAAAAAAAAVAIWQPLLGPNHFMTVEAQQLLGEAELGQGAAAHALLTLEPALAYRQSRPGSPARRAEAEFAAARAWWQLGKRARAQKLAAASARDCSDEGPRCRDLRRDVDSWQNRFSEK